MIFRQAALQLLPAASPDIMANAAFIRVRDVATHWVDHAPRDAWAKMAAATLFALCYAGGTAAAAGLVAHLVKVGDVKVVVASVTPTQVSVFALFLLRPLFYIGHIHLVQQAIRSTLRRESASPPFVSYMLTCLITLSRDVPAVVILSAAMLLHGGWVGLLVAAVVVSGLGAAVPLRDLAFRYYARRLTVPTERQRRIEALLQRRVSRSWAEASADGSFALLILALLLVGFQFSGSTVSVLIGTSVTALLMTTPVRRIARLLGNRRERHVERLEGDSLEPIA